MKFDFQISILKLKRARAALESSSRRGSFDKWFLIELKYINSDFANIFFPDIINTEADANEVYAQDEQYELQLAAAALFCSGCQHQEYCENCEELDDSIFAYFSYYLYTTCMTS